MPNGVINLKVKKATFVLCPVQHYMLKQLLIELTVCFAGDLLFFDYERP